MTKSRHHSEFLIRSLAMAYPSGMVLDPHSHDWSQLVYASEGVMQVEAADGIWTVPPQRAVWIPAGVDHSVSMSGRVSMRTLYLAPPLSEPLPARCSVVAVSPLLRELILYAVSRSALRADVAEDQRLADLLIDQLQVLPVVALELPMPRDPRALRAALRMREDPGRRDGVDALAREAGASRRTLERRFRAETGLSLGRWRQQARLLHALGLLAHGQPVTAIALDVGYDSPSAFIAAFSTAFGTTPGRYYRRRAAGA